MQRRSKRSRLGVSAGSARHFSVRRPRARMFHVAMSRLRSSCFAGIASSRATRSSVSLAASGAGGGSLMWGGVRASGADRDFAGSLAWNYILGVHPSGRLCRLERDCSQADCLSWRCPLGNAARPGSVPCNAAERGYKGQNDFAPLHPGCARISGTSRGRLARDFEDAAHISWTRSASMTRMTRLSSGLRHG